MSRDQVLEEFNEFMFINVCLVSRWLVSSLNNLNGLGNI